MITIPTRARLAFAAALLLPALAGCSSRQEREAPAADEMRNDVDEAPPAPAEVVPEPAPLPTASPTPRSPAAAPVAADEQMLDDATATGMTARTQRGDDAGDAGSVDEGAAGNMANH